MNDTNHRFIPTRHIRRLPGYTLGLLLACVMGGAPAVLADDGSGDRAEIRQVRSKDHQRHDRYDHDKGRHHGYERGDRHRDRRYDRDRHRRDRHRYDRHRSDRHRYDRHRHDRHRYDRHRSGRHYYDRHRYGHHRYDHYYRGYRRHFEIPRRLIFSHSHGYHEYFYGRVYHDTHRHYHDVYRFPVYGEYGVSYHPYAYCEGSYYKRGVFRNGRPSFEIRIGF